MITPDPGLDRTEAVIFDLDGTLYLQKPVRRAMLLRLLRAHLTRPLAGYRTIRFLSAYRKAQEELRIVAGTDAATRQLEIACEQARFAPGAAPAVVDRWMGREPLDLLRTHRREGLVELLEALRADGRKLALLSDYPAREKLAALEVEGLFDVVVCAQDPDVGAFKPSPRGLDVTLRRLGVQPRQALYVGDRPEVDYLAAKAAGVSCAIFSSAPRTAGFVSITSCRELKALLLGPR